MAPTMHRSRIHLLAAKEASTAVILQRKRAKLFHIIMVDTESHSVNEGSWFRGRIHEMKCDISFDGKFMIYLAIGKGGGKYTSWSGVCRLPWLKTLVRVMNVSPAEPVWRSFRGRLQNSVTAKWRVGTRY